MARNTGSPDHIQDVCLRGLEAISQTELAIDRLLRSLCLQYMAFNHNHVNICSGEKFKDCSKCYLARIIKSILRVQKLLLRKSLVYYSGLIDKDAKENIILSHQVTSESLSRSMLAKAMNTPPCRQEHWHRLYLLLQKATTYHEKKVSLLISITSVQSNTPAPPYFAEQTVTNVPALQSLEYLMNQQKTAD